MEMPPVGKGDPLTPAQIALLRAWIDQGAAWDASPPAEFAFSISPVFGGTSVSGDVHKFREHYGQPDGLNGGLAQFDLTEKITPGAKLSLSGHALLDDYKFVLSLRREDLGFIHSGWEQYRKYFDDTGGYYQALVGTALGDDMVLASGNIFEAVDSADIDEYKRRSWNKRRAFQLDVEIRDLPEIFEMEYQSEIWQELGEKCLSCGSCSMVCPTCYCYDVADDVELGSRAGKRTRSWDSCLFANHALVASGENFRGPRASRIKFRFYHKQRGFVAEYGRPSCVGCGRCISACPVNIDVVQVIDRLRRVQDVASR